MTSLLDYNIGLNCNPPKGEPGKRYEKICEEEHREAVRQAIAYKAEHKDEIVEIWPMDGDIRMVVREVGV